MIGITAIVVCYNEARRLSESLKSLSFCDEILVFDMGSTDGSLEIATRYATKVISIPRVEYLESILPDLIKHTKNKWVISQDPDEVFSSKLAEQLEQILEIHPEIAKFEVPLKFYFMEKPLTGTIWGGDKFKGRVFNKEHVNVSPLVVSHAEMDG